MSFRPVSIVGIGLIQAALIAPLTRTGLHWLEATNLQQLGQRAQISAQMLALSVAEAMLGGAQANMAARPSKAGLNADLRRALVFGADGALLAGRDDNMGFSDVAPPALRGGAEVLSGNPDHVDGAVPIIADSRVLGRVEVGLATSGLDVLMSKAHWFAFSLAALQILLVLGLSALLTWHCRRQLAQLQRGADRIAAEDPGLQAEIVPPQARLPVQRQVLLRLCAKVSVPHPS